MHKVEDILQSMEKDINTMSSIASPLFHKIQAQNKLLTQNALSCKEICELLGITEPTLIKRRKLGLIPFFQLGRNFYYLKPEGGINNG